MVLSPRDSSRRQIMLTCTRSRGSHNSFPGTKKTRNVQYKYTDKIHKKKDKSTLTKYTPFYLFIYFILFYFQGGQIIRYECALATKRTEKEGLVVSAGGDP
jgi:hypothetical protein